jgi:DNA-directed RNA polymerase sigma subunit (sigma70/sigma32)
MGTKPKTLRALGKAEGITDAGVKKRIGKAIEKLRKSQLQG